MWTQMHAHREKQHESRDWGDAVTNRNTLKTASKPSELGERHRASSPSQPMEGTNPADTMISDIQPPQLGRNKFLLL